MPSPLKYCPLCASPLVARPSEGPPRLACPAEACGYVFYDNPVPVVAALLEHGGTVLLVRNRRLLTLDAARLSAAAPAEMRRLLARVRG